MAWITVQVAQNGNSSRRYRMVAFSGMTVFDVVSAGPEAGSSAVRIFTHEASAGPTHVAGIETIGSGAVTFRVRGGLQL
jgi:hypothetical protein